MAISSFAQELRQGPVRKVVLFNSGGRFVRKGTGRNNTEIRYEKYFLRRTYIHS